MPTVSVVIPAYNRAHLIAETIESALGQDVADMEVLVVDDDSIDDTASVVGRYTRDHPVRYIRQQNGGPASARNTGIAASCAPLIAFLDSDDLWTGGKLRQQVELMERRPDLGLVFTGTETRDASLGRVLRTYRPTERQRGDAFSEILVECFVKTSSVLIRREVLDQVGHFDTSLFGPEDWELFARVLSRYPVDFLPEPYVIYRSHPGSIQTNIDRWAHNDLMAMDRIFALPRAREYRHLLSMQRHRIYSEGGIGYFYRGQHNRARAYLLRALRYGADPATLSYLVKSCLPAGVLERRRRRHRLNAVMEQI